MTAAAQQLAVAYYPPDAKFWFIWTDRGIRVQHGSDAPSLLVLPAPVALPRTPPYAPAVQAFTAACDAWLANYHPEENADQ